MNWSETFSERLKKQPGECPFPLLVSTSGSATNNPVKHPWVFFERATPQDSASTLTALRHNLQGTLHPNSGGHSSLAIASHLPSGILFHHEVLAIGLCQKNASYPRTEHHSSHCCEFKRCFKRHFYHSWLLLTWRTTSFFFAAILLQQQGSFEQHPPVQSPAEVFYLCKSSCWPTCSTEKAFHLSSLLSLGHTAFCIMQKVRGQSWSAAAGPEPPHTSKTAAGAPHPVPRELGKGRGRGLAVPAWQLAAPQRCYRSPGNAGRSSSTACPAPPAPQCCSQEGLAPSPLWFPSREPALTSPTPSGGVGKLLAPLQMQLSFKSFLPSSFAIRAHCWVAVRPAGRRQFQQSCCSPLLTPVPRVLGLQEQASGGFWSHGSWWPPAGQGLSWLRVWLLAHPLLSPSLPLPSPRDTAQCLQHQLTGASCTPEHPQQLFVKSSAFSKVLIILATTEFLHVYTYRVFTFQDY